MEIDPAFVGTCLKDYRCTVSWRQIMNYAAAVHDQNPWYFNDEQEGGIIAPPMLAVALTWPIFERFQEFVPDVDFPMEVLLTQVHYTEDIIFHRPIRPGDELTIRGRIAAIMPHRAGTHAVIRLDAFDSAGAPVFTEYNGGMLRGISCGPLGQGESELPVIPQQQVETPPIWEKLIHIDPLDPFIYDGCTNIFFPIHTSMQFAHAVGLPGIILQGTATLALAVREIINREAGTDPGRLKKLSCRFGGMVIPGEDIKVQLTGRYSGSGGQDIFFEVLNASGGKAVNRGYARIEGGGNDKARI